MSLILDLLAWLAGGSRPVVVNVAATPAPTPSNTTPLVAVAAVLAAILAAFLANRYTLNRERRTELTAALDRLVQGYTAADEALAVLLGCVERRETKPDRLQAAADKVSACEIETRGAHKSMLLRLKIGHPVEVVFTSVAEAYMASWLALQPALVAKASTGKWDASVKAALPEAREIYEEFGSRLALALDVSRKTVGAVRA